MVSEPQSPGLPPARRDLNSRRRLEVARKATYGPITMKDVEAILKESEEHPEASAIVIARHVNRCPETVTKVIKTARAVLGNLAEAYVMAHFEAVQAALANGDSKSLAAAIKGSQWAIENIGEKGERVVDGKQAAPAAPATPAFNIGIAVGGVPLPGHAGGRLKTADVEVDALPPAEVDPEDDTP